MSQKRTDFDEVLAVDFMKGEGRPSKQYVDFMGEVAREIETAYNVGFSVTIDGEVHKAFMIPDTEGVDLATILHGMIIDIWNLRNATQLTVGISETERLTVECIFKDGEVQVLEFGVLDTDDYERLQELDGTKDLTDEIIEAFDFGYLVELVSPEPKSIYERELS